MEPGEECRLDWWDLAETPWGEKAYVLVGALSHSGRLRAMFSDGQSFPHLIGALDCVLRASAAPPRPGAPRPPEARRRRRVPGPGAGAGAKKETLLRGLP